MAAGEAPLEESDKDNPLACEDGDPTLALRVDEDDDDDDEEPLRGKRRLGVRTMVYNTNEEVI